MSPRKGSPPRAKIAQAVDASGTKSRESKHESGPHEKPAQEPTDTHDDETPPGLHLIGTTRAMTPPASESLTPASPIQSELSVQIDKYGSPQLKHIKKNTPPGVRMELIGTADVRIVRPTARSELRAEASREIEQHGHAVLKNLNKAVPISKFEKTMEGKNIRWTTWPMEEPVDESEFFDA
jgi:hypothetical protein